MKKIRLLQTAAYALFATTFLFGAGGKSVKNGTYKAAVGGMNGDVEVSVTIKGKKITQVEVTREAETPGIGTRLKDIDVDALIFDDPLRNDIHRRKSACRYDLTVDVF